MAGVFIVFEGGEGSGKSTQARRLYTRLYQTGASPVLLHEPGGTPLGEEIRRLLTAERGDLSRSATRGQADIGPLAELMLFSAARAELVANVIRPSLEAGRVVICDRYTPSTVAYQGHGRGLSLEAIMQVNLLVTGGLEPDLIVFLDIPPAEALPRVNAQVSMFGSGTRTEDSARRQDNEGRRRFEQEPFQFHRKVYNGYRAMARAEPGRWYVVDGKLTEDEIAAQVWRRLEPLIGGSYSS